MDSSRNLKRQDEDCEIKFLPRSANAECNLAPVEFSTLTNTRLLQYEYLSGALVRFQRATASWGGLNLIRDAHGPSAEQVL
jgi:hypothetical protein